MSRATSIQTSFTTGEVSPRLRGRVDLDQYYAGLDTILNFTLMPHGGATKRPGTSFVAEAKYADRKCRLIPFEFSTEQAYVIEAGHEYFRFCKDQGQIVGDDGTPYEIASPFSEDELAEITWAQSADVLFLCHPDHRPMKLSRTGHTAWTLEDLETLDGPYLDENEDVTIAIASSSTGELVSNGGFDSNINGWTDISSNGTVQWDSSGWCNLIGDSASNARPGIQQCVDVEISKTYKLNFEIKSGPMNMQVGTTSGAGDLIAATAYSQGFQESQFTAGSNAAFLQFWHTADASRSVDNISIPILGETRLTASGAGGGVFEAGHVGSMWRLRHGDTVGYCTITEVLSSNAAMADIQEPFAETQATTFWREGAWSGKSGWPRCTTFHENRLWFAGTKGQPQSVWASVSNDYLNFAPGVNDSDAITLEIVSNKVNAIRWLRSSRALMVGTVGGAWRIGDPDSSSALTPATAFAKLEDTNGVANLPPIAVGGVLLFVQRAGRKLRELAYDYREDRYTAPDMTIISEHITAGGIVELDFAQEPDSIVWCVRGDGALLGFTYNRTEKVLGWHRHATQGQFESIACIPGDTRDEPWFCVKRSVEGQTRRFIEFMEAGFDDQEKADAFFVDSALSYAGSNASVISGLDHLEGCAVYGLADGGVVGPLVVQDGSVTLPAPAGKVHLGLPYVCDLGVLPVEGGSDDGSSQAKIKKLIYAAVLLHRSLGLKIGPTADNLETVAFRSSATPLGQSPDLYTGWRVLEMDSDYERSGCVYIRHDQPLPCTVLAVVRHYETMAL